MCVQVVAEWSPWGRRPWSSGALRLTAHASTTAPWCGLALRSRGGTWLGWACERRGRGRMQAGGGQRATLSPYWAPTRRRCAGRAYLRVVMRGKPLNDPQVPRNSTPGPGPCRRAMNPLSVVGAARRVNGSEHCGLRRFATALCDPRKSPQLCKSRPDRESRGTPGAQSCPGIRRAGPRWPCAEPFLLCGDDNGSDPLHHPLAIWSTSGRKVKSAAMLAPVDKGRVPVRKGC